MPLPQIILDLPEDKMLGILSNAEMASSFLRALSHEGRLMILCHLVSGPKSVTELKNRLFCRQSAASQQLTRLRHEGLVDFYKDGKHIYYFISDRKVMQAITLLHGMFCQPTTRRRAGR